MSHERGQRDSPDIVEFRHRRAEVLFGAVAFLVALWLISQIGNQTSWISGRTFVAQPAFWPAISIGGMLFFGGLELGMAWRRRRFRPSDSVFAEISLWFRALEYVGWFMIYVAAVPRVGYLPTTIVFCGVLTWRLGYRGSRIVAAAAAMGVATVIVFKAFLSVRIPAGALYEYLPDTLRNFFTLYL